MKEKDVRLTKRQEEVLDYLKKYIAEHGFPPAVREICQALGLSSPATVQVHLQHLKDAGIINFCYNLSEPALPLISNIRLNSFKIYMRDTGLLIAMLEEGTQKAILEEDLYINEGALLENIFASEITTKHDKLMYFERKSKLEIDFILNIEGKVTAIEVKSGNNKQAKSLMSIVQNYKTVTRYIKFEKDCNVYKDDKNVEHYPLFMIMYL